MARGGATTGGCGTVWRVLGQLHGGQAVLYEWIWRSEVAGDVRTMLVCLAEEAPDGGGAEELDGVH